MSIPDFTLNGVLPPFLGSNPAETRNSSSPHEATALEVIEKLATNARRCRILQGWLDHRAELRKFGYHHGFQWLDGSFVEAKEEPGDLDIVHFVYLDQTGSDQEILAKARLLQGKSLKDNYFLDSYLVNLAASVEDIIGRTTYWYGLFSHQRNNLRWKGILRVRLEKPNDDELAQKLLHEKQSIFDQQKGVSL
ncbi:MAG: hypothetical protein QM537_04420 [Candidatus Symbiobacter sp.]|nr:hypothetical protein [Candidatus Symbiobacter sp.]